MSSVRYPDDRVWYGGDWTGDSGYRMRELRLPTDMPMTALPERIERRLRLSPGSILAWRVARESIDARDKRDIHRVYTVDFLLREDCQLSEKRLQRAKAAAYTPEPLPVPHPGTEPLRGRPVVIGFGPCGIFAALCLAEQGYRPLVLERGAAMEKRILDVQRFRSQGLLNPESNVLYGEGGAGTFSDGKLMSGIRDVRIRKVLRTFADAGAGEDILYKQHPHIGTDVLREVIVRLRERLLALGGELRFGSRLSEIAVADGQLSGLWVEQNPALTASEAGERARYRIDSPAVILAMGHSARDTFRMLQANGVPMEAKPFSIGVRITHPQALIDRAQYGDAGGLPPAEYKLSYRASNGRGVYSFCMCPGGEVIVCSTEPGQLSVNGMSRRRRDSGWANSGILCDVRVEDFPDADVLAGVAFQEHYERLAYAGGGSDFRAPSCSLRAFLSEEPAAQPVIRALPDFAAKAIREAIPFFATKLRGFDDGEALVTAVETRSSSPVRVLRDPASGESKLRGLYPAGEGCGYAGGITSAACDGLRQAERLIARFARP